MWGIAELQFNEVPPPPLPQTPTPADSLLDQQDEGGDGQPQQGHYSEGLQALLVQAGGRGRG